jgi:hypothetical protein
VKHYIPKAKPVLERHIENKVVAYAKSRDCLHRKMNGLGNRSWPDQLFISPTGVHGYLELKRAGEEPTELQWEMINELAKRGVYASWADCVEGGKAFVDNLVTL